MVKIIGLQGVAGSGKTTLTQNLGKSLSATTLFWEDFDPISTGPSDYVECHPARRINKESDPDLQKP